MILSRPVITFTAILTWVCPFVFSQQPISSSRQNLSVRLTASVSTPAGENATGLAKDDFEIIDGKTRRPADYFEAGDRPASVIILIDTSNSVLAFSERKSPEIIGEAVKEVFVAGHPDSEYVLASFDVDVRFLNDWKPGDVLTADKLAIGQNKKQTAFYDACFQALERFATARYDRKTLILISDGQDNTSRHTFKQLSELLKKSDVVLYGVLISTPDSVGSSLGIEGENILTELTKVTGGELYLPQNKKELAQVFNRIGTDVRHQYRIGFHVDSSEPATMWHRIKVRVTPSANAPAGFKKLKVRVRSGYYAP